MKKPIILLIVLVVIGLIIWKFNSNTVVSPQGGDQTTLPESTTTVAVSEQTKVSDKISEYKNGELGFSVKYPVLWKFAELPASVTFNAPIDTSSKNSVNNLESKVEVIAGKCSFPPVTTIKERATVKFGVLSFNMISMSNSVQGKNYFNRMYTLQKDSICYVFTYSSITLNPTSKGFSGGEIQQVNVNNKAIVEATDLQFKDMVKSFTFLTSPKGEDEVKVSPKK